MGAERYARAVSLFSEPQEEKPARPRRPRKRARPDQAGNVVPFPLAEVSPVSLEPRLTGQCRKIWDFLKTGQWIDDEIARAAPINCRRLGARIWDIKAALEAAGFRRELIETEMFDTIGGARVARYRLRAAHGANP